MDRFRKVSKRLCQRPTLPLGGAQAWTLVVEVWNRGVLKQCLGEVRLTAADLLPLLHATRARAQDHAHDDDDARAAAAAANPAFPAAFATTAPKAPVDRRPPFVTVELPLRPRPNATKAERKRAVKGGNVTLLFWSTEDRRANTQHI